MTNLQFESDLATLAARYPELFADFRSAGWDESRRVAPEIVAREPYWPKPFPMHELARELLTRFSGIEVFASAWSGVKLGCKPFVTARTLKATVPYDLERLVLGESWESGRPPAFPIATMNDWMIFLREDWSAITVSYRWRDVLLSRDPFEIMSDFRARTRRAWSDPTRHIEVTELDQVPAALIGGAYDS